MEPAQRAGSNYYRKGAFWYVLIRFGDGAEKRENNGFFKVSRVFAA